MKETTLIVVRHAETTWNREKRMQGTTDTTLSDVGRAQAQALSRRLARQAFSALYSSDLSRARDTAHAIAQQTRRELLLEPRLRERAFGIFEGLIADEIRARYPEEYARFASRDPDYEVPGGESARGFTQRCLGCLAEIANRHPGEDVVVVTHGLVLDSLYRAAHGLDHGVQRPVPLINASVNLFGYGSSIWRMVEWGDVTHLAEDEITVYRGSAG
ncbi:MAG: histidine phosphatase family protein [Betaproteobacteria bacterium]|nr:histidine phosphatase family protein [Betaproteobacteria bacterium]MDH3438721.1 histidine phosphatase family protein [Betaproteobacteria bacterium]